MCEVEIRVSGIPALACNITGSRGEAACYYGPSPCDGDPGWIEYDICDRRGRAAPWLQRKIDADERLKDDVERQIYDAIS